MQGADFFRDRLAQSGYACHGWVLVVAGLHRTGDFINQLRVASEVRETLSQINSLVLGRQRRHDSENRRTDFWEPADQFWGLGVRHGQCKSNIGIVQMPRHGSGHDLTV